MREINKVVQEINEVVRVREINKVKTVRESKVDKGKAIKPAPIDGLNKVRNENENGGRINFLPKCSKLDYRLDHKLDYTIVVTPQCEAITTLKY